MSNHLKFSALLLLTVVLLNALICTAAIGEGKTAYVASNTVRIYEKWDTSSKCIYAMSYGEALTCTTIKNGWAQLKARNGAVGYCQTDALSTTNPCSLNTKVLAKSTQTPVYKSLVSKELGIAYIDAGTVLNVVGTTRDGSWLRVKNGRYYGYVSKDSTKAAQFVYMNPEDSIVDLHAADGTSIASVSFAQSLLLLGVDGNTAAVQTVDGKKGYISLSYLISNDPNTMNDTAYVQADGAYIYKTPSNNGSSIARLAKGDTVTVTAYSENWNWYRVEKDNVVGYMHGETLAASPVDRVKLLYCTVDHLSLVDKMNSSASTVATLKLDEPVAVVMFHKTGIQVVTQNGITGFCAYDALNGG